MATFLELQDRVEANVIDLPTPVLNAVPRLINKAMKKLQRKHNFQVMKTLSGPNLTTVDTRVLMTVPSDWKEWRDKPYMLDDTNGRKQFLSIGPNRTELLTLYDNTDDGPPVYILEAEQDDTGAGSFEVWPLPDGNADFSDGEYRIYLPYWRFLPELSADADTNWFTVNADDYLEYSATSEGFRMDWDKEQADSWRQDAMLEYGDVLRIDKMKALAGVDALVPHLDYYDPRVNR